jgi:quercetin dioxygenase-like cupin family protein
VDSAIWKRLRMDYVVPLDTNSFDDPGRRVSQRLYTRESGARNCHVSYIQTPVGEGSGAGLHTHPVDQVFYLFSGRMGLEIDGAMLTAGPHSLIIFPANVPHRNWNIGEEPTRHLSILAPLPALGEKFAIPVEG